MFLSQLFSLTMSAFSVSRASTALFSQTVRRSIAFRVAGPGHRQVCRMSIVSQNAKPLYDLYVKGSPEKGELGDCAPLLRLPATL